METEHRAPEEQKQSTQIRMTRRQIDGGVSTQTTEHDHEMTHNENIGIRTTDEVMKETDIAEQNQREETQKRTKKETEKERAGSPGQFRTKEVERKSRD